VVVFMIHARRNAEAGRELLGTWRGVLVTDRWRLPLVAELPSTVSLPGKRAMV
jgi:hypothetical protein